ncbi:head-tail adaptor protein [uncultured Paraglaciecola sp.]|uniref:head-tail adaptor protein n=1 Tax=uncultured Paraglaciecola sp. TaxID=1765024 RepID=UPI0026241233|nr:head-tail adaptor protein [uncultured Paraglaciecola sp.]
MRTRLRAGRLRYQIQFQEAVDTPDDAGGQARTWNTVLSRRCDKEDQGGKVFHALQKRFNQMTHLFILRDGDINPEWRILFNSEPYRIIAITVTEGRQIQISAESENQTRTYGH